MLSFLDVRDVLGLRNFTYPAAGCPAGCLDNAKPEACYSNDLGMKRAARHGRGGHFTTGGLGFTNAQFTGGMVRFDGARFVGGSMTFVCAEFAGSEVNFTNAHFTGETLTNAGTAGLHAR